MFINFVKEGEMGTGSQEGKGILSTATDWEIKVDLHHRPIFPEVIVSTPLRPDIVLWSKSTKQVVIVKLTVP